MTYEFLRSSRLVFLPFLSLSLFERDLDVLTVDTFSETMTFITTTGLRPANP